MAISLLQKIRLALRGWSRRREEDGRKKQEEFLRRNMSWGVEKAMPPVQPVLAAGVSDAPLKTIDREGLQAAYLDGSGQISYYLDLQTGDVVESRDGAPFDAARYKRVPVRGSENDERRAFIETLEPSRMREMLMKSMSSGSFRSVLASNRSVERAWYNFRNSRATEAIEVWLKASGLR